MSRHPVRAIIRGQAWRHVTALEGR
jgi:hypothetical protein